MRNDRALSPVCRDCREPVADDEPGRGWTLCTDCLTWAQSCLNTEAWQAVRNSTDPSEVLLASVRIKLGLVPYGSGPDKILRALEEAAQEFSDTGQGLEQWGESE